MLQLAALRVQVQVFPAQLAAPKSAVCEKLAKSLLRYNQTIQAVLLAFKDIKLEQNLANISTDYNAQLITVSVNLTALIFTPKIGQRLVGALIRKGSDHLALLVYGAIHATIPDPPQEQVWEAGQMVPFVVRSMYVSDGLLSILGQIGHE